MISEFFSLLKTLGMAVLILFLMQFKIENQSIESRIETWLEHSPTSLYLQSVAAGGVNLIRKGSAKVKTSVQSKQNDFESSKAYR